MAVKTIIGPLSTRKEAETSAKSIGLNCSVYGVQKTDSEGYALDECDWFVEQDDSIPSGKIFGYDAKEFMARQYK
jgi:hypothetical protein